MVLAHPITRAPPPRWQMEILTYLPAQFSFDLSEPLFFGKYDTYVVVAAFGVASSVTLLTVPPG